jgi:hypothetical protein
MATPVDYGESTLCSTPATGRIMLATYHRASFAVRVTLSGFLAFTISACALAQQFTTWDDGDTENPPSGDGITWGQLKNWEDDIGPSGTIGAVVNSDVMRVADGISLARVCCTP